MGKGPMKVKKTLSIEQSLWKAFEEKVKKEGLSFSKGVERAITFYVEKDKRLNETVEYLHWIAAIACKLWLEGKKEAKVLFEAVRRTSKLTNSFGIEILATAFVNPENEFVLSAHPWALIHADRHLVRLIVNRCDFCGKDTCPCIDIEDCDKVEIEEVAESLEDALKTLAKLYLSYFFSSRAYEDGIGSRIEIMDEYLSIKKELEDKGILTNLSERDWKKIDKIRKRREEIHKEAHLKLVNTVVEDYKKIQEKVGFWRDKFEKELEDVSIMDLESILNNCVQSLNNLYLILEEIRKKSRGEARRVCVNAVKLIAETLEKLNFNILDKDHKQIKISLENLNKALELIVKNADKIVKFDIKPNSLIYNNRLAYGIRSIVATITCLESIKKQITSN